MYVRNEDHQSFSLVSLPMLSQAPSSLPRHHLYCKRNHSQVAAASSVGLEPRLPLSSSSARASSHSIPSPPLSPGLPIQSTRLECQSFSSLLFSSREQSLRCHTDSLFGILTLCSLHLLLRALSLVSPLLSSCARNLLSALFIVSLIQFSIRSPNLLLTPRASANTDDWNSESTRRERASGERCD